MSDDELTNDPIHRRAAAAAAALVNSFADLDVEADLDSTRHGTRPFVAAPATRRWFVAAAALLIVAAGTVALVAVSNNQAPNSDLSPATPQPTVAPPSSATTSPAATTSTSVPESTTTTTVARSTSPIASVSYLDPPPELTLRPLASLDVPAEESGSYSVAVGDLGVAVSQWTYSDNSVQRLDVVDFSGQSRSFPDFGGNALLAYGPGDVLYMTQQGTSIEEFAVVAISVDGATEVRREPENVNLFLEYPPMSFGHTATGVVHRREYLADESPIIDYVNIDGQPVTLNDAPPTFRFETAEQAGAGLGGTILSSVGTSWTVAVDAAPDRADTYVGISPPSPATDGRGIYVTHIGPNADPSTDFGAPSGWVIADLQPGGTATWWSVPDGWEVVASDTWGTVLGRRAGTTLELALADFR